MGGTFEHSAKYPPSAWKDSYHNGTLSTAWWYLRSILLARISSYCSLLKLFSHVKKIDWLRFLILQILVSCGYCADFFIFIFYYFVFLFSFVFFFFSPCFFFHLAISSVSYLNFYQYGCKTTNLYVLFAYIVYWNRYVFICISIYSLASEYSFPTVLQRYLFIHSQHRFVFIFYCVRKRIFCWITYQVSDLNFLPFCIPFFVFLNPQESANPFHALRERPGQNVNKTRNLLLNPGCGTDLYRSRSSKMKTHPCSYPLSISPLNTPTENNMFTSY